ncbi:MAG: hypothetical protein LBH06_02180 [Rikenellaceae bacterium]|jgi:hypothetical protein|nr:hypothetical protein [Rikenellaceae bacterium]
MEIFNFTGRPDGIGNRLEEVIILEVIGNKHNTAINYVWQNRHVSRSYPILLSSKNVNIVQHCDNNAPFCKLSDFSCSFSQEELLSAAKSIRPTFGVSFARSVKPTGIHIRGTDRIGRDHPHFMKDATEFNRFLSKTIELLNTNKPPYVFICADDEKVKSEFTKYLDQTITIVEPVCEEGVPAEYKDFFALTLCSEIYMCSKFSTYSIVASLIGNIPLVTFYYDKAVSERYKALFRYEPNIEKTKPVNIVSRNYHIIKKIKSKLKEFHARFANCSAWIALRAPRPQ